MSLEKLNAKTTNGGIDSEATKFIPAGNSRPNIPEAEQKKTKEGPAETSARARKAAAQVSRAVAKVMKKAAILADLMTDDDLAEDMRVLRDAKKATSRVWDIEQKKLVEIPDHKTRLAATTFSRAYKEGLPVQRQVVAVAEFKSIEDTIAKLRASPELLRAIANLNSQGIEVEADGEPIDIETIKIPPKDQPAE